MQRFLPEFHIQSLKTNKWKLLKQFRNTKNPDDTLEHLVGRMEIRKDLSIPEWIWTHPSVSVQLERLWVHPAKRLGLIQRPWKWFSPASNWNYCLHPADRWVDNWAPEFLPAATCPKYPRSRWLYPPGCCDMVTSPGTCGVAGVVAEPDAWSSAGLIRPCWSFWRFRRQRLSIRRRTWWAASHPDPAASPAL